MTTRWATAMSSCSWLCRRVEVESVGTLGKQISSANTPRTNPCAVFSLGECHSQPRARHAARQQVVDRTLLRTPPASDNRWAGRYPERHYRGKCRQHRTRSSTKRNAPRGPIPRLCRESPNSLNVEMGRRAGGAQVREHAGALLHPSHLERVEDAERLPSTPCVLIFALSFADVLRHTSGGMSFGRRLPSTLRRPYLSRGYLRSKAS